MSSKPRILIVGGGIGGLTLAAALGRRGLACEVVEKAPAWEPVGAGITLGINAMRALKGLGLEEAALDRGRVIEIGALTDARGRILSQTNFIEAFGPWGKSIGIHRAGLHEVLLGGCGSATFRMGVTPSAIEAAGARVAVAFSDGTSGEYDLVVGADGIRSQVRELVFGAVEARYSGYACWRFVVEGELDPPLTYEMWGRGRRFGLVPLRDNRVYGFATINAARADRELSTIDLEGFRRLYADFGGPAPGVLAVMTPVTKLIYGDLEEVSLPSWVKGRVALIGDAAHAMTPNLGQGAAMAMEDASALAEELGRGGPVEAALAAYESRRRPRATRIQRMSWRQGRLAQSENPVVCTLRNGAMRLTPAAVVESALRRLMLEEF
jgi:2-heptyl-3-hydroxy-4(1H)-quinolone synthase